MKNNLFKKASALFLAVALATTGMPLGLVGAGEVQAAYSPTNIKLNGDGVVTTVSVGTDGKIAYGKKSIAASEITVAIAEYGESLRSGKLSELEGYLKNYSDIVDLLDTFDFTVGSHEYVLTLIGKGTVLYGQTTATLKYTVTKPSTEKVKAEIYIDGGLFNTSNAKDIQAGETFKLSAKLKLESTDYAGGDEDIQYSLASGSDEYISVKSNGRVTGLKITPKDPIEYAYVNVKIDAPSILDNPITETVKVAVAVGKGSMSVEDSVLNLAAGATKQINVIDNVGAVSYTSETPTIATVSATGLVTAVAAGKTTITVKDTASDSYAASDDVKVTVNVTANSGSLTLAKSTSSVAVGADPDKIAWTSASNGTVRVNSADTKIATVDLVGSNVEITGVGMGTTYVHVKQTASVDPQTNLYPASDEIITVTVTGKANPFKISDNKLNVKIGGSDSTIRFESASDKSKVSVTSSNEAVAKATVVPGDDAGTGVIKIDGLKVGTATISVTDPGDEKTVDPSTLTIDVTVSGNAGSFTIEATTAKVEVNEVANVAYANAAGEVTYEVVPGTGNVSVTKDAFKLMITGTTAGTAVVKVHDSGDDTTDPADKEIQVEVSQKANDFALTSKTTSLQIGKTGTIPFSNNKGTVTTALKSGTGVITLNGTSFTADKTGTAVITVTDPGTTEYAAASDEYTVTVTKKDATFTLTKTSASIVYGKTTTIAYSNAAGDVTFSSSSSSVATVDKTGKVTAKKVGKATITVKDAGSDTVAASSKTFAVTVTKASQTITISPTSGTQKVGATATYKISGAQATPTVTTSSSKIAKVSSKFKTAVKIKAVAGGTATITVKVPATTNYKAATKTFKVKVTAASQTIKVSPTSVSLAKKGATRQLKVTGAKTKVTYKSSNTKVAKVSSKGKITAVKKGKCTITVTAAGTSSYSKATKKVNVTVKK